MSDELLAESENLSFSTRKKVILSIVAGFCFAYYLVLTIVDLNFFSISLLWLGISFFCVLLLILNKLNKLKPLSKVWKIILIYLFSLGFLYATYNLYFILTPKKADNKTQPDYIILLGSGVRIDESLSNLSLSRVQAAYDYWSQLSKKCPIIITGGKLFLYPCTEAELMEKELLDKGVPIHFIIQESDSKNTIENLKNSAEIILSDLNQPQDALIDSNIVLVTNNFHLSRALYLAKKIGYTSITGYAAKTPYYTLLNCYTREILAVCKLHLKMLLGLF